MPTRAETLRDIERLDRLAWVLDANWRIPGTRIRFGVDQAISFVPVVGDVAAGALASYIVYNAARHGAPRTLIMRMMVNLGIDMAFGSVPLVGTVFDVFFKVSKRNMALLRQHLIEQGELDPAVPDPFSGWK
jgi:hypothetical protein